MESAAWRSYRGHLIIARRTILGLRRYDLWRSGELVDTFRDEVVAELHVDALLEGRTIRR